MSAELRDQLQQTLGDAYRVDRELGGGGMSRVFVAEERALDRFVVVKVLTPDLAASFSPERFAREIQFAARLQHACIVPVLTAGQSGGLPYYTMPFVDGVSLRTRIAREGELPIGEAVRILRDVTEALSHAHEQGVVHRDIKPDNVLLTKHHALVTDFGVAKALDASAVPGSAAIPGVTSASSGGITGLGVSLGTPAYMAPEQVACDPATDHRADLYSLGAMAYEMLTGHQLFSQRSPQALLAAQVTEQPEHLLKRRPGTPKPLAELVMRLLAKRPADRPQTADEVLRTLETVATSSGETVHSPPRGPASRAWIAGALAAAIVLAAVVLLSTRRGRSTTASAAADSTTSIAVLPFDNLSGDPQNEYLSDGMSEQLIGSLSKVKNLRVAARTSSFAFKGRNEDARAIGAKLGVGSVLGGSVRRVGNRLRVSAQLTNTTNGFNLWSETFDRDFTDVFAVQDEITGAIVASLKGALGGSDSSALRATAPKSVAAYEAYLKGLYNWNRRGREGLQLAIRHFNEAIAKDSTYAPAYAGLAQAYLTSANWSFISPREAAAKARVAATRAIALDDRSAEAHAALGNLNCQHDFDFTAADREFRRAMELNPGFSVAQYFFAWCFAPFGRFDEALAAAHRARASDPLNPQIFSAIGKVYFLQGREREGLEALRPADDLAPNPSVHAWRSWLYYRLGDSARTLDEAEQALKLSGGSNLFLVMVASALHAAGKTDSARAVIRRLERDPSHPSYHIAVYYAQTGDSTRALAWLDTAYAERADWITMLALAKEFAPYRTNPRVVAILRKLGMENVRQ